MPRCTMLAVVLLAGLVPDLASAQPAPSANDGGDDANQGHVLFLADGYYECHGTVGQGSPGPRIAPRLPPYTSTVVSNSDLRDIAPISQRSRSHRR